MVGYTCGSLINSSYNNAIVTVFLKLQFPVLVLQLSVAFRVAHSWAVYLFVLMNKVSHSLKNSTRGQSDLAKAALYEHEPRTVKPSCSMTDSLTDRLPDRHYDQ